MESMGRMFFLLLFFVLGIVLQVFLSKRESRWPGLLLPFICFLYSILMLLSIAVYQGMKTGEIAAFIVSILLFANIPTSILLAIYFAIRKERGTKKAIEKMNIQDLE